MANDFYSVYVSNGSRTTTKNWVAPYTTPTVTGCDSFSWHYSGPTYIYMYDISCPKCNIQFWAQIDIITQCPQCKTKLKPTTEPEAIVVHVNKPKVNPSGTVTR